MPTLSLSSDSGRIAVSDGKEHNPWESIIMTSGWPVTERFVVDDQVQWEIATHGPGGPGTGPKALLRGKIVQIVYPTCVPIKTKEVLSSGKEHSAVNWMHQNSEISYVVELPECYMRPPQSLLRLDPKQYSSSVQAEVEKAPPIYLGSEECYVMGGMRMEQGNPMGFFICSSGCEPGLPYLTHKAKAPTLFRLLRGKAHLYKVSEDFTKLSVFKQNDDIIESVSPVSEVILSEKQMKALGDAREHGGHWLEPTPDLLRPTPFSEEPNAE